MCEAERVAIRTTAVTLAEAPGALTRRFYQRFFERHPEARELFGRDSQADQSRMLHDTIVAALDHLDDALWLESTLVALGHRHRSYEVRDEMYAWFNACLLETLRELAGSEWTPHHESGWTRVLEHISARMRHAGP